MYDVSFASARAPFEAGSRSCPNEAFASRERDRLSTVVYAELDEDSLNVGRDRIRADHEFMRDLGLIHALDQESQNLPLTTRKLVLPFVDGSERV